MSQLNPNIPIPSIQDLADNHARTLQQALAEAALASGAIGVNQASDMVLSRSNVNVQSVVTAMGVHGLYRWLRDYIARQAVPIWARGTFLDGWLETYGLQRKTAVAASGTVTGTGAAGVLLSADSLLQTSAGVVYRVTLDAIVDAAGQISVPVVALNSGTAGNVGAQTELTLIATVADLNSIFTASGAGINGGSETETDPQAVYRLVQRLSNEPMGGAPSDYERWALSVPGITRAWGVRNPSGSGTSAGVMIMADGNPDGLPSEAQIQAVYDYIRDPKRGPPDELFVFAPKLKPIKLVIDLTPDGAGIRDAVMLELKDLFFREAQPNVSLPHTHLSEAVSIATGEYTHRFVSPELALGAYFIAGEYELLTLGEVTFV